MHTHTDTQWLPSHRGILENERPDALAASTHSLRPPIDIDRFAEEKEIIADSVRHRTSR